MKKFILSFILTATINANASLFNFFDYGQFFQAIYAIADVLNENLEKVRLKQQQVVDIRDEWNMACEVTQTLNPSLLALNRLLASYKINQNFCAPITTVIKLQTEILEHCNEYYSKPVPENAAYLLSKYALSLFQSKMILTKCFPLVGEIPLPPLPNKKP